LLSIIKSAKCILNTFFPFHVQLGQYKPRCSYCMTPTQRWLRVCL